MIFKKSAVVMLTGLLFAACTTDPYTGESKVAKTGWGAMIGAGSGALIAGLTSNKKNRTKNMLIAAGIGTIAGGGVGAYMDNQDAKLRAELQSAGVQVSRQGDNIILNMSGDITFATNSYDINTGFYDTLDAVGKVLVEYDKTYVDVSGHADSTGNTTANQTLSYNRAASVAPYLVRKGVKEARFVVQGFGSTMPKCPGNTASAHQCNRRVEIQLSPIT